jgi:hypothetical protein
VSEWKIQHPVPKYRDCSTFAERKKERIKMSEERWHEAAYVRRLEARVEELEALAFRPHELAAMHELTLYLPAIAESLHMQKVKVWSQIIAEVLERIETKS